MNTNKMIPKTSSQSSKIINPGENRTLSIPGNFSGDLEELEERVKSMMEKSKNKIANGPKSCLADRCKVCGKKGKKITLKQTTWKESSSPATSAIRHSECEIT